MFVAMSTICPLIMLYHLNNLPFTIESYELSGSTKLSASKLFSDTSDASQVQHTCDSSRLAHHLIPQTLTLNLLLSKRCFVQNYFPGASQVKKAERFNCLRKQ